MSMPSKASPISFLSIAPYWAGLVLVPMVAYAAIWGGWWFLLPVLTVWVLFTVLDKIFGLNKANLDPETDQRELFWYELVTLIWAPIQFALIFAVIWYTGQAALTFWEKVSLFYAVGLVTGAVGINYAHELMHKSDKLSRNLADWLLAMAFYSHFRSEHLLVHHVYVGTPRDAVTARYNENFHRFFLRVIVACAKSAFRAEKERLAKKNLPWYDLSNPFFLYWGLQALMLVLAFALAGWEGIALFLFQAYTAILILELINYVEHYGLTRKHLGGGKYEHVKPHHSWNAGHTATNWLLINLQRHSDHHYKPGRAYPLLQTYPASEAPQLPFGYAIMAWTAVFPTLWRCLMNPKVRKWREMYYPEIQDWSAYNKARNPISAKY